jgi:RNA polymerase sigma-70 factor (ECF subfamily)
MSHSSIDIDALLRYHQTNDAVIIEAMVEQYRSLLYHLALSILNDPSEAEDATQDAFVNASLHLDRYIPGTNLKAWLYSITVNVCRGYLRKQHTRKYYETLLRTLHSTTALPADPELSTLENEHSRQLWAAVSRLGVKHQLVVVLRIIHELPISEIAYILGINEKTVYTRLYDAFRKLRKRLNALPDSDWVTKESS